MGTPWLKIDDLDIPISASLIRLKPMSLEQQCIINGLYVLI